MRSTSCFSSFFPYKCVVSVFIYATCTHLNCTLTLISIPLSTVYQGSDRLCVGGSEPVWLPAIRELENHPRNQAIWGPLLPCNLPQLQTWWKLWPAPVGSKKSHRQVELFFGYSHFFMLMDTQWVKKQKKQSSFKTPVISIFTIQSWVRWITLKSAVCIKKNYNKRWWK